MRGIYDLIAIGAGPAGESATELASFFGHRCLVVERDEPGGTVTTTGGVPTKTLREAALYFAGSPPEVLFESIRRRTREVCEALQEATAANVRARGVDYLRGRARLAPGHTVVVASDDGRVRTLRAKAILIATGSRPTRPCPGLPADHPALCDTDSILKRGRPPQAMLIVGGGAVAVEFATIARTLDIDVTVASLGDRLLTMMDGELSQRLGELMDAGGVRFVPGATIASAVPSDGSWLQVTLTTGETVTVDTVLFAAGRIGNTEDLGLEEVGVEHDGKGRIRVDDGFHTTAHGIFAAGDVIHPTLASTAMEQGRAAACHAFHLPADSVLDTTPVSAVYGMPEVARVGLTEEECRQQGLDYEVGRSDFLDIPRGAIAGRGGLLKLIFLKDSRKLIGVHCIGDIASEVVGIGQMAMRLGGTIHSFVNMTMNTPTYSYAYKYAAFDGIRRVRRQERGGRHAPDLQPSP